MAITALPTPPSRQDPTNFNDRADAFLGALPQFQSEANVLQTDVNAKQQAAAISETNAAISAQSAANTANSSIWVSGTTYAVGDNRFSPINYLTYRRKTAGAGTTDPSADSTNWQLLTGLGDLSTTGNQVITGKKTFAGTDTNLASIIKNAGEICTISTAVLNGSTTVNIATQSVLYYTSPASGNFYFNLIGSSTASLNTILDVGQSVTVSILTTQGTTAYYSSGLMLIDGNVVSCKWLNGYVPSFGNINSVDAYTFTIIKTASATYTVLATQTKYA